MTRSKANQLNSHQLAEIANDVQKWSLVWCKACLEGEKTLEVGGEKVSERNVVKALIQIIAPEVPAEVWKLLRVAPPLPSNPDAVEYLEPLAARAAIPVIAFLRSVAESDAITRDKLAMGMDPKTLLEHPPKHLPESHPYFQQIEPILEEVRTKIPDALIIPEASAEIALGRVSNEWRLDPQLSLATKNLDVWPTFSDIRITPLDITDDSNRSQYIDSLEEALSKASNESVEAGDDRRNLVTAAVTLENERTALVALGVAKTEKEELAAIEGEVAEIRSNARANLVLSGVAGTVAVIGGCWGTYAAEGWIQASAQLMPTAFIGAAAATIVSAGYAISSVRGYNKYRNTDESNKAAQKAVRERVLSLERIDSLSKEVQVRFAMQCSVDDAALDELKLNPQAAARAMVRREVAGRAPSQSSPQWNAYSQKVLELEVARREQRLPDADTPLGVARLLVVEPTPELAVDRVSSKPLFRFPRIRRSASIEPPGMGL